MIGYLPKLTKNYILNNIGVNDLHAQIKIFAEYLMIPEIDISESIHKCVLLLSPLRKDSNPTCSFYIDNNNVLRFRDWAGYFWGDCWDLIGYRLLMDCNDSIEFNKILEDVAKRFRIHKYKSSDLFYDNKNSPIYPLQGKPELIFYPQFRDWNNDDIYYWNQYYLTPELLENCNVYPLYSLHINKKLTYLYSYQDPGYIFQTISKGGNNNWECYFPKRDRTKLNKFLRNHSFMGCLNQIKTNDYGIITKSRKDVVCIKLFDDNVIHTASESTPPKDWEIELIKKKWNIIYTLFDFDRQGVVMSNKMRKLHGTIPLFFTNGRFSTLDFGIKDFSDYLSNYKINQTKELVEYLNDMGTELTNDFVDFFQTIH